MLQNVQRDSVIYEVAQETVQGFISSFDTFAHARYIPQTLHSMCFPN